MSFGAIYSYTFWLIRRSMTPTVVSVLTMTAFFILASYGGLMTNERSIAILEPLRGLDAKAAADQAGFSQLGALVPLAITFLCLIGAYAFTHVMVTLADWDTATDQPRSVGELAGASFGRPFWSSVLQIILIGILGIALGLLLVIFVSLAAQGNPAGAQPVFIGAIALLGLAAFWFLTASISRTGLLAIEERGPWRSISAAFVLGRGQWWRNCFLALIPLLLITGVNMLIALAVGGNSGQEISASSDPIAMQLAQAYKQRDSFSWAGTIVTSLMSGLVFTFLYHLSTAIYIDLRARRGDFLVEGEEEEEGTDSNDPAINW